MTNKAEEDIDESPRIGSGDLLAFGSINLLLTLNLTEHDLKKYKVEWENLDTIKDLRFIRKHKHFWKRVELSSNDNTMNILLHINKTSKRLVKIGFVGFTKIVYKDKQAKFQEFINTVTKQNGLFITYCDVCKSKISIQLLLKYLNEEKIFLLSGEPTDINKPVSNGINQNNDDKINDLKEKKNNEEDKNEKDNKDNLKKENNNKEESNSKENKEDIISQLNGDKDKVNNPFVNLLQNKIYAGDFTYIYFSFNDYIHGEFKGKIKL